MTLEVLELTEAEWALLNVVDKGCDWRMRHQAQILLYFLLVITFGLLGKLQDCRVSDQISRWVRRVLTYFYYQQSCMFWDVPRMHDSCHHKVLCTLCCSSSFSLCS